MTMLVVGVCWFAVGFVLAHVVLAPAIERGPLAVDRDEALLGLAFVATAVWVALG